MNKTPISAQQVADLDAEPGYDRLFSDISGLLDQARRTSARAVNSILTATYWEIGRRIIEFEQSGRKRAEYGESLLKKLASDLTGEYGRGFSRTNLQQMRIFYLGWKIRQTASGKSECRVTALDTDGKRDESRTSMLLDREFVLPGAFLLSWSHYVHLMSVPDLRARSFYESESIAGGWSVRQLDRQIGTQFYERSLGSKNRDDFLARGRVPDART